MNAHTQILGSNQVIRHGNVTIRVRLITSAEAEELLKTNTDNRPMRPGRAASLARILTKDLWQFNGASIIVDENGVLLDGQHRLQSCVSSGVPITTIFIEGMSRDVMPTIDRGSARTAGDYFKLQGELNYNYLAATLRLLVGLASGNRQLKIEPSELGDVLELNPRVRESVSKTKQIKSVKHATMGMLHYVGSVYQGLPTVADEFVEVMITGVPAYKGCPAQLLRERLISEDRRLVKSTEQDMIDLHIHTWNNFSARASLTRLVHPKNKPVLVGLTEHNVYTQH